MKRLGAASMIVMVAATLLMFAGMAAAAGPAAADIEHAKALALLRNGQIDAAHAMLSRLVQENPGNMAYQVSQLTSLVEQIRQEREKKSDGWKGKAQEAKIRLKALQAANGANADYYLAYARYAAYVERDAKMDRIFQKALYFKPGYAETFITKGDVYTYMAKNVDPYAPANPGANPMSSSLQQDSYARHAKAREAKESYETALKTANLDPERRAYALYMLGVIEQTLLLNKETAAGFWKKAIETAPESYYGKRAKDVLNAQ